MFSVIIAGSRTVSPEIEEIDEAIGKLRDERFRDLAVWSEVVCGCAPGADRAGERWAEARKINLHHEPITRQLIERHGKYLAPKMRNRAMAERGDYAIVFWDGTSGGSADMVCRMVARGKPVEVVPWKKAPGVRR